jgi:neuronal guanine nucleotide exchange factor
MLPKHKKITVPSNRLQVRQCSEKFLEDLEKRWQSSFLLNGLCDVVRDHAENHFQVYVKYCSNQVYQDRILKKLR